MTAVRLFLDGRSTLLGASPAFATSRLQPGRVGSAPTSAVSVGTDVTLDTVNQRFRAAAVALSAAFRSLGSETKPVYTVSVAQPTSLAKLTGQSARLDPVPATPSVLGTTVSINTQTSTTQISATPLGLDVS